MDSLQELESRTNYIYIQLVNISLCLSFTEMIKTPAINKCSDAKPEIKLIKFSVNSCHIPDQL